MNTLFKNIIKGGLVAFAVGAALALVAPIIGTAVGLSAATIGISASPMWVGAYFGAWGALTAAAEPIANWIFGDKRPKEEACTKEPEKMKHVSIVVVAPQAAVEQKPVMSELGYRHKIQAERVFLAGDNKTIN